MSHQKNLSDIRRDYGQLSLNESALVDNPLTLFETWFAEVVKTEKTDPTAMVLSTVDDKGRPDSRVVLLKGIQDETFVFYTNYESLKAKQISLNPFVSLNFYWPEMVRQVRIRGTVRKTSKANSDAYFASRPRSSQLGALCSPQSRAITSREELEQAFNKLVEKYQQQPIMRPEHWGGYAVMPEEIEFWQGRDNRLHDRIRYFKQHGQWKYQRLAP